MSDNLLALPKGYQLNHYRIDEVLGQGGFGIVYRAHHELLDETVAIKEFLPVELASRANNTVMPHTSQSRSMFDECRKRFIDEGRVLIKLKHPNIVRCRDLFEANETAYLVMDFEEGLSFDVLLKSLEAQNGHYTESQLLFVSIRLAEGLHYVHQQNVLHRDIKPGNVFVRRSDNTPVLLDFGAAKQNFAEVSQSQAPFTEFYAPIDQLDTSSPPTTAIDIHAFGGLLYRAVTGTVGPKAETRTARISMGQPDPLPPASQVAAGKYSYEFLALIDQCLAFKPEDRPASMQVVIDKLRALKSRSGETQISIPGQPFQGAASSPSQRSNTGGNTSVDGTNLLDELLTLAGSDGVISSSEMKMLLSKAQEIGMSEAEADNYITQRVRREGWRFESVQTQHPQRQPQQPPPQSAPQSSENRNDIKEFPKKKKGSLGLKIFVALMLATVGIMIHAWMNRVNEFYLTITTTPENASIEVTNADDKNSYPIVLQSGRPQLLPEGSYRAHITAEGYRSKTRLYQLKKSDLQQQVDLEIKSYELTVNTTPSNAIVKIGSTNYEGNKKKGIKLAPGEYSLEVTASGYEKKTVKVDLSSRDRSTSVILKKINYASIASAAYNKKDYKKALENYRKAANAGDANAMDWVGYLYENGYGVTKDYKEAIKWYKKSADKNHANGISNLADMYYFGYGTKKDYKESLRLYKKAVDKGYKGRYDFIAYHYEKGHGTTQNYYEAVKWYKKGADAGNTFSYKQLGDLYEEGKGVTKSISEAKKWNLKCAEKDDQTCMERLGRLHYTDKNYSTALTWFRKAADKNSYFATNYLGWMYRHGYGVSKNEYTAVSWFRKGANKEHRASMSNLGYMYENGKGVSKSVSEAVKWYKKAAKKGDDYSQGRLKSLGYTW